MTKIKFLTLDQICDAFLARLAEGHNPIISTGIYDLDRAISGGFALGEMTVIGGRPGMGKTAFGLQLVRNMAADGRKCLIISEEMTPDMLAERTITSATEVKREDWIDAPDRVWTDKDAAMTTTVYVAHCVRQVASAVEHMKQATDLGVEVVVLDYLQLLDAPGKDEYARTTAASRMLMQAATDLNVCLISLCQLSRAIEKREDRRPKLSDLRGTGQIEQDARLILFVDWPVKNDRSSPYHEYKVYAAKCNNREIRQSEITLHFEPSRQTITDTQASDMPNYDHDLANWN